MGNCMTSNGILAQNKKDEQPREAKAIESRSSITSSSMLEEQKQQHVDVDGGKKKKKKSVRFKLHEEDGINVEEKHHGHSKSGAVRRIRVVVTQRELIQILNSKSKYSSVEQMLKQLKNRKISQVIRSNDDEGTNGVWRPALESIPEDH